MSNAEIEKSDHTELNDWLDEAIERIKNMSREELIACLDKHNIQYEIKEENQ